MPTNLPRSAPAPMIICSLLVAALTACGGGTGGAATTASGSGAVDSASSAATDVLPGTDAAAGAGASAGADMIAGEPAEDIVVVEVQNDPGVLLADSDPGSDTALSALAVKATSTLGVPIAKEGQTFPLAGTASVRYGAGNSWVTKTVSNSGTCSNTFFGSDPLIGTLKSCQVLISSDASTGSKVATSGLPVSEGGTFYVFGTRSVQYGANGKFVTRDVSGRVQCTTAVFGKDPSVGGSKVCQLTPAPFAAPVMASVGLMPAVDKSKIPAPVPGFATARVKDANVAAASQNPNPSDIGSFREYCEYSHMSYDDPIAAPGSLSPHLHTFLGNSGTNANSTAASIAGTGNSTCAGGTLNRTAYWVPTVIDTRDGAPQVPMGSLIYYKQGYNYIASKAIKAFPPGLRMVAGNSGSASPQENTAFTCFKTDGTWTQGKSIPTDCPTGATLTIGIAFPQCWDGLNLDAPDHKSHMAYPGIGCPASHPVPLTAIAFNINYKVGIYGTSGWRLSSDNYNKNLPGGYSSHADWMNGWDTTTMNIWTTRCINATMDCHAFLIGDGRILY